MRCGDCLYFDDYDEGSEVAVKHGFCRVNPPFPVKISEMSYTYYQGEWPRVDEDDWCGEFRQASQVNNNN